jgi:nitrogen fixation protein FixH
MTTRNRPAGKFTGRHMLVVMLAFFGVVIAVNATMATLARTSWTGLVADDTFVASQQFNQKEAEGRAQAALGWKGTFSLAPGLMQYSLTDASGTPVALRAVKATFKHPAYESQDRTIEFSRLADGRFGTSQSVRDGVWIIQIDADAGRPYRQVERVLIQDGKIQ